MAKYTFICEEEYGTPAKRTIEFSADSLDDILNEFEMFLRGSGFYFKGTLDVVPHEYEFGENEINFDFSEISQNNWPFNKDEDSVYVSEDAKVDLPKYGAAQPVI